MPRGMLLRGAARTAVVAGTATAVRGRVQRRQSQRWAEEAPPDPVELRWVERKKPAGHDSLVADAVEPDRPPVMLGAGDRGRPVGQNGEVIALAGQEIERVHAHRR